MRVSVPDAARHLGVDPRTVRAMIKRHEVAGGAEPRPHRPRWYVYADQLAAVSTSESPQAHESAATYDEVREAHRLLVDAHAELQQACDDWRDRCAQLEQTLTQLRTALAGMS